MTGDSFAPSPVQVTAPGPSPSALRDWAEHARVPVSERLRTDGVCWLRGTGVDVPDLAARLLEHLGADLMADVFFSTPRAPVADGTYTATLFPARESIPAHSEMSYLQRYPRLLCFHALRCPTSGGQTTLVDLGALSRDLGELTARFLERGVRYTRVFRDGLDIPLHTAFGTSDPQQIESIAADQGMTLIHPSDATARLTFHSRGALHGPDGPLWFNQVHLFHPARLPDRIRSSLSALVGEQGMPRQAFYGDGGAIKDETVRAIITAFERRTVEIAWQPGDLVVLDNQRFAHGRRPYEGERTVHVAMGMPCAADAFEEIPSRWG
jgi:hypothetical protein